MENTTWDGAPISPEKPHGATIVVYRQKGDRPEFLVLHRAHDGPAYEGDWAWTPPSGARYPGESVDGCAARELREETGLALDLQLTDLGTEDWAVYLAEAPPGAALRLSAEHDRCEWVSPGAAAARCRPERVSAPLAKAARLLRERP